MLEALGSTNVNLVYDVSFNREVVDSAGYYFNDSKGNFASLIGATDLLTNEAMDDIGTKAKERIKDHYNWPNIISDYEELFNDYPTETLHTIGINRE